MRDLDLGKDIIVPASSLRAATSRSSGPGGQHVNKTETRVTIELDVDALPISDEQKELVRSRLGGRITKEGVLHVSSQAERSQLANRDRALARMEELLRAALVEQKPRKRTRASRAAKEKRVDEKKKRGQIKRTRGKVSDSSS